MFNFWFQLQKQYISSKEMGNCSDFGEFAQAPVLGRLGPVSDLRIVNTIWLKDYQGLFDFQSKEIKQQILKVVQDCFLIQKDRHKGYLQHQKSSFVMMKLLKKSLFEVIRGPNFYKIMPIYVENQQYTLQKLLWLIIKSVPNHKYPLKQKDILKFGKQKVKIRQIVLPDINPSSILQTSNVIKTSKKIYEDISFREIAETHPNGKQDVVNEVVSIATQNQQTCRICLQPGQLSNPLICPCKCTGSVRYIHLQCLRTWLGKQLKFSKTKYCITIKWTPLHCQMCKTHYKYRIYLDNKKFYTVQIPKPAKPYVVIEIIKKSAEYSKIFHFISLAETSKLSIGRRKDIDIKLSQDISVSRHHANLIYDYENRQFFIEDNKSKFGTLVLVKRNLIVSPKTRGISFQMGGQIFTFETHRLEGSIPDYYDEERYLNVFQKGSGDKAEDEQSDQNNDQEDDFDQQIDENMNISQHPTQPIVPIASHAQQNHPEEMRVPNQPRDQAPIHQIQGQSPNNLVNARVENRLAQAQIQNLDV